MAILVNKFFPCIGVLGPSEGRGKSAAFISFKNHCLLRLSSAITDDLHKRKHGGQFPFFLCYKVGSKEGVNNPNSSATYEISGPLASTNVIWNGKKMTHNFSNMLRVKYLLLSCLKNEASVKCLTRKNMCESMLSDWFSRQNGNYISTGSWWENALINEDQDMPFVLLFLLQFFPYNTIILLEMNSSDSALF